MFRKILVANDLSDASRAALATGLELGRLTGAEVRVLYVSVPVFPANHWYVPQIGDDAATLSAIAEREEEAARARLEADVSALGGGAGGVAIEIAVGSPAEVILDFARTRDMDLIVVGTHSRSGVERLVLGSVAEKISRRAICSVLTVHPVRS